MHPGPSVTMDGCYRLYLLTTGLACAIWPRNQNYNFSSSPSPQLAQGCWLLLEDLERASPDVSSLLLPVLQHGALPGLPSNPGFQLLATHREGGHRGGGALLPTEALWASVTLDHPSREEMEQVRVQRRTFGRQ